MRIDWRQDDKFSIKVRLGTMTIEGNKHHFVWCSVNFRDGGRYYMNLQRAIAEMMKVKTKNEHEMSAKKFMLHQLNDLEYSDKDLRYKG
jgi:hypothetical protein